VDVLMDFAIRGSIRLRLQWKPPIIGFLDHIKQPFFFFRTRYADAVKTLVC